MPHKKHGIPKRFSVAGNPYAVKFFRKPRTNHQDQPILGFWDSRGTIEIFQQQAPIFIRQVFLHEMLHALLHHAGRSDLCNDENLVDTLAWLMMGVVDSLEYDNDGTTKGLEFFRVKKLPGLSEKILRRNRVETVSTDRKRIHPLRDNPARSRRKVHKARGKNSGL